MMSVLVGNGRICAACFPIMLAAHHGYTPASHHFLNAKALQQLDQRVHLIFLADNLDNERFHIHIHNAGAVNLY